MHRGKDYPYAPEYWATEGFFWPGFVPWKMRSFLSVSQASPWDALLVPFNQISAVVEYVPDRTQCAYVWTLDTPSVPDHLRLSLEQLDLSGTLYNVWKAQLITAGMPIADAWLFQENPQYVCAGAGTRWWDVFDPSTSPAGPDLNFLPATYAEGGSPWD